MDSMLHQLFYTFILGCRNRYNSNSKTLFKLVHINSTSVITDFIHHVESNNNRYIQLNKLHCKVKISFNICRIYNIDYSIRLPFEDEIT